MFRGDSYVPMFWLLGNIKHVSGGVSAVLVHFQWCALRVLRVCVCVYACVCVCACVNPTQSLEFRSNTIGRNFEGTSTSRESTVPFSRSPGESVQCNWGHHPAAGPDIQHLSDLPHSKGPPDSRKDDSLCLLCPAEAGVLPSAEHPSTVHPLLKGMVCRYLPIGNIHTNLLVSCFVLVVDLLLQICQLGVSSLLP